MSCTCMEFGYYLLARERAALSAYMRMLIIRYFIPYVMRGFNCRHSQCSKLLPWTACLAVALPPISSYCNLPNGAGWPATQVGASGAKGHACLLSIKY